MQMYLNDSVKIFEFVLKGELTGDAVQDLEHAWITATSILNGKELFVDVAALTVADPGGVELLQRMTAAGARVTATPKKRAKRQWILSFRRLIGTA